MTDTVDEGGESNVPTHLFHCTGQKAGMSTIDMQKTHQVIYQASKDSAYYKHQEQQAQRVSNQLERVKEKISSITEREKQAATDHTAKLMNNLRQGMQLNRTWICIDLDMFYAAVAIRDNPDLHDKPVAVGSTQMISTASYVARQYGVRSAMPGFIALKLCPQLVFVKHDFPAYQRAADQFRAIFAEYDPSFSSWSLDEAVLDVTDYINSSSPAISGSEIAEIIRRRIFEATQLTASAGIACNQMLAKICSDMNKPNGQYLLNSDADAIRSFMNTLPCRKIPGIGRVTERILKGIGVETCGQFVDQVAIAKLVFTPHSMDWLTRAVVGIGRSQRSEFDREYQERKSISVSRTFRELSQPKDLEGKLSDLALKLFKDLDGHKGKTLTITVKSVDFKVTSKSVTLPIYISSVEDMVHHGLLLLRSLYPLRLRLMGLRLSTLAPSGSLDQTLIQSKLHRFFGDGATTGNGDEAVVDSRDDDDGHDLSFICEEDDFIEFKPDEIVPEIAESVAVTMPVRPKWIIPMTYAKAISARGGIPSLNRSRQSNIMTDFDVI